MGSLRVGEKAPEFLVKISEDKKYSLESLKGKYIVLYFYPKDDTPGCTLEAIDFNELLQEFHSLNAVVLGVSRDDLKSHNKFKDKYNLKFHLGSDLEGETCSSYGVWGEKSMFGKKYMGVNRATFLIDKEGKIVHVWPKVSVEGHAREVLNKIRSLSA
jgi:peroxiredoxin Q/BCP